MLYVMCYVYVIDYLAALEGIALRDLIQCERLISLRDPRHLLPFERKREREREREREKENM